jgi:hypothetical protein
MALKMPEADRFSRWNISSTIQKGPFSARAAGQGLRPERAVKELQKVLCVVDPMTIRGAALSPHFQKESDESSRHRGDSAR